MDYSKENNNKRRKKSKSKRKKAKNKVGVMIFRVIVAVVLIGGFAVGGAAVGALIGVIDSAPVLDYNVNIMPENYATIVYDDNTASPKEVDRFTGEENREFASLGQMPENLKNAFIAIEDERFYSHNGIDLKGIGRAFYSTVFQDRRQGASTITQQLIKNNVMEINRNTIETKIKEIYLAVQYESLLEERLGSKEAAKDYILEAYLNTIGLNHGLNGVQTAAKYYFNSDVSELTLPECAVIAAITQNPTYYTPAVNPDNNKVRQRAVLKKMLELEFITQAEYNEATAMETEVYNKIGQYSLYTQENNAEIHNYFMDQLIDEVVADLMEQYGMLRPDAFNKLYSGGLQIYTTMNEDMQNLLEATFKDDSFFSASDYRIDVTVYLTTTNKVTGEVNNYERIDTVRSHEAVEDFVASVIEELVPDENTEYVHRYVTTIQPQAAMVVMDYHNGHVKALVGGRGEKTTNRGFNRATQSKRQPGSVFKVLAAYAPAIDMGIVSPGSIIVDEFLDHNGYKPNNWNGRYLGPVTVRDGIVNSMNIVTVKVLIEVGLDTSWNYLMNFGFENSLVEYRDGLTDKGYAIALGGITDGVTQLEVTAAYGAIANDGVYLKPAFYTKVLDHDGNTLLEYDPETGKREVLKKSSALMLTDMMKDAVTSGTGARARFTNVNMPVAGKTGTSQETKDLTFAGYTPYYVSAIWLGYDRGTNMTDGASYHLGIWKHVMEEIHQGLEYKDFEKATNTTSVSICMDSGKRPVAGFCDNDIRGSRVRSEAFTTGGGPTEYCDVHVSITIDTLTGRLATDSTPADRKMTIIGVKTADSKLSGNEWEIPESMLSPGSTTQMSGSFINDSEEEEERTFDPERDFPLDLEDWATVSPSQSTGPSFPSFYSSEPNINTPVPTAPPGYENNTLNPTVQTQQPTPQPTPNFTDVPIYNTPAVTAPPVDTPMPEATPPPDNNAGFGISDPVTGN